MVRAADRAAAIGASALQVFSDNPTSWRRRPTLPRELPAFLDRLDAHGISPLAIHAPYLVNLAGPEADLHERSVAVLANELRVAADYGARFVNVHVGSHRGSGVDAGIDRLADGIRRPSRHSRPRPTGDGADRRPILRPPRSGPRRRDPRAGERRGRGLRDRASLQELGRIERAVTAAGVNPSRFGYCLDTAHAWGAGYAIDTPDGVDAMLDEFDLRIGLHRLRMIHLNDSRSELGSRADRHEHIGAGRIGAAGLRRLVTHPSLDHVAYYLETPGHGGRLGRRQRRARPGPGGWPGPRAAAARGVPRPQRQGPQRTPRSRAIDRATHAR